MGYKILTSARKAPNPPRYCQNCGRETTHYKLESLYPVDVPITRSHLPPWLVDRVLRLYDYREAITGRKRHPKDLTVDHRIPNIRWHGEERKWDQSVPDKELLETFQLLTNEDNLWKSRMCEECKRTGKRQPFLGINYFYLGGAYYDESIGCKGCGWYDPESWRRSLNELLEKLKREHSDLSSSKRQIF
ncbi:MAG: hypothetical protein QXY74_05190 [Candidatus Bathyarchaeia archaeon]